MLKLSVVGILKDTIIQPAMMADYLLFRINLRDPRVYETICPPTNDIEYFLTAAAKKTGRLKAKAEPDLKAAALWMVQRWRSGKLGKFVLDEITADALEKRRMNVQDFGRSPHQAKKKWRSKSERRRVNYSFCSPHRHILPITDSCTILRESVACP